MADYMNWIKENDGYCSLKAQPLTDYPPPGGVGNFGIRNPVETDIPEEEQLLNISPLQERYQKIISLENQLKERKVTEEQQTIEQNEVIVALKKITKRLNL